MASASTLMCSYCEYTRAFVSALASFNQMSIGKKKKRFVRLGSSGRLTFWRFTVSIHALLAECDCARPYTLLFNSANDTLRQPPEEGHHHLAFSSKYSSVNLPFPMYYANRRSPGKLVWAWGWRKGRAQTAFKWSKGRKCRNSSPCPIALFYDANWTPCDKFSGCRSRYQ